MLKFYMWLCNRDYIEWAVLKMSTAACTQLRFKYSMDKWPNASASVWLTGECLY